MVQKFLFSLLLFISCIMSCTKFTWNNPFDPDCPKELFTPTNLSAVQEGEKIKLTWQQENTSISGFQLMRSVNGAAAASLANLNKDASSFTDTDVVPEKKYSYSISAFAGKNTSNSITAELVLSKIAPIAPSSLRATVVSPTQINLEWLDNSTTESAFIIQRKTEVDSYKNIGEVLSNTRMYSDNSVVANTTYTYRVYSSNSAGNSISSSNEVAATTILLPQLTTMAISAITNNTANSGGVVSSDGGASITAKGVVWSTSPSPTIDLTTKTMDGIGNTEYPSKITGLTSKTKYYIRAYATNTLGTSYGNEISFTTISGSGDLSFGLVANYAFDGTAYDSSINANHGVLTEVVSTKDRFGVDGKALDFSSTFSYIKTKGVIQDVSNNFTIAFWVNPMGQETSNDFTNMQTVIHPSMGKNWGNSKENAGVGVNVATNQIKVLEHTEGYISYRLEYIVNLIGWHHIAIVYNNRTPSLYIDGVFAKTGLASTWLNVRPSNGNDDFYFTSGIGKGMSPSTQAPCQFKGSLDELKIYSRVLSVDEISALASK